MSIAMRQITSVLSIILLNLALSGAAWAQPVGQPTVAASAAAKPSSGPAVAVDLEAGYGGLSYAFGDRIRGPVFSGGLNLLWGAGSTRAGLRLRGYYGQGEGESTFFFTDTTRLPVEAWFAGGNAMFVGDYKGLWGGAGFGVLHIESLNTTISGDQFNSEHTWPEFCLAAGYNLALGKHVALRLSGEVGTNFWLSWRASINGGVQVRF